MIRGLQTSLVVLCANLVLGHGSVPDSGGAYCPPKAISPTCDSCCKDAGGDPPASTAMPIKAAAGTHNTPASAPATAGSLSAGGSMLARGIPAASNATQGRFAGVDLMTGVPEIVRTDLDWSSNGMLSLHAKRTYLGPRHHHFGMNSDGYTMLGPDWMMSWEMRLILSGYPTLEVRGLRDTNGGFVFANSTGADTWQLDPGTVSGVVTRDTGTTVTYTLAIEGGDAKYKFSWNGSLLSMEDRNGNLINFIYQDNAYARLVRIEASEPDDRFLELEYYPVPTGELTRAARLRKITCSWNQRYVEYFYSDLESRKNCRLTSVSDSFGRTVEKYTYDTTGNPYGLDVSSAPAGIFPLWLSICRPNVSGELTTSVIYLLNRVAHSGNHNDAFANIVAMYDGAGNKTLWKEPGTNIWRQPSGLGVEMPYTEHTFLPTEIKWYDLNAGSTPLKILEQVTVPNPASGMQNGTQIITAETMTVGSVSSAGAQYEYYPDTSGSGTDPAFSRLYKTAEPGKLPVYHYYTPEGRPSGTWISHDRNTSTTYDAKGNAKTVTRNGTYTTTYNVDGYGRLLSKVTPLGTTSYVHNDRGFITQITDVEGRSTNYTYNDEGLRIAISSLGTTTTIEYDTYDRPTTTTDHLGNETVITYGANDQVIAVTDPMGHTSHYDYSTTTGLLSAVTDAEGGVISYEYDWAGKLVKLTDQRGHSTTYAYDVFGRLVSETNPLNQITSYAYDDAHGCGSCGGGNGNVASVTDPAGLSTHYAYDAADRLTTVTYSGSSDMVVHTYAEHGRRVATFDNRLPVADFPTQTFTWTYDKFDRMLTETYPDGEVVAWTYDIHGRRTSLTDPDGNVAGYVYKWNNLAHHDFIYHPVAGDLHLYYSAVTGGLSIQQNYDLTPVVRYRHQDDFYYDPIGRVSNVWSTNGARQYELVRINNYNAASMKIWTDIFHVDYGLLVYDYGSDYAYDDTYRLKNNVALSSPAYDVSNPQARYSGLYTYDLAGNRNASEWTSHNHVPHEVVYDHNDFNQLIDTIDQGSTTFNYEYDLNGNQVLGVSNYQGTTSRIHDRENRLILHKPNPHTPAGEVEYTYDFSGRLLMKKKDGHRTKTYYDGINKLMTSELPPGGSCWRTKGVYALKQQSISQVIAMRDYIYSGTSCTPVSFNDTWYKYDEVGNVIATLDDAGAITRVHMDPFGRVLAGGYNGPRLTSKEYDEDSKLYYFGARWYDPGIGRFAQTDPILAGSAIPTILNQINRNNGLLRSGSQLPGSIINRYQFNYQSPMNYVDPTGGCGTPPHPGIVNGAQNADALWGAADCGATCGGNDTCPPGYHGPIQDWASCFSCCVDCTGGDSNSAFGCTAVCRSNRADKELKDVDIYY